MACEKPQFACTAMRMSLCQLCGKSMQSPGCQKEVVNYQKLVDSETPSRGPQPPLYRLNMEEPTIVHTPVVEYRVTGQVTGKPANQSGVTYIMNHGMMGREDVEGWVEKKKRLARENVPWVGDGTYVEFRPEMLHCFGNTTHLFLENPENPYENSRPPKPVCKPRDGLDH